MIFPLKNARAVNLQAVLTDLLEEEAVSTGGGGRTAGRSRRAGSDTGNATAAGGSDMAGQVRVVADEDTNALMLMTAPRHFDKLRAIIEKLDRPTPQVLIKVLIAEVTHENDVDLGVEFSAMNLRASGRGPEAFTDFNLAPPGADGLTMRIVETDLTTTIRALEEIGNIDVLSRPYILTSDNRLARITVGQEVPFITDTRTTESGDTLNTIAYEDIGIILTVTPHINPDGLVVMDVSPEISSISETTVPISEFVDASVFNKRSATSRVAIGNGQTIVIGGLMQDRKEKTVRRVPLLGHIPLLGYLFRRTETMTTKTELLIFLTPHVAQDSETLASISSVQQHNADLVHDAVQPGTFQKHMDSMQGKRQRPLKE
jgi:general secretion pathway protein D